MYFGTDPYDLEKFIKYHGDASNMYRGEDFGQPRTLHDGDILANDLIVDGKPKEGVNGGIDLRFSDGTQRRVPARVPLQLKSDKPGVLPAELKVGHILQTGCVILDEPLDIGAVAWHDGQHEVQIKITGGWEGHEITVPADLPLAVFEEVYPPSLSTVLGAFALERTLSMHEDAKRHLPRLGQLVLDV